MNTQHTKGPWRIGSRLENDNTLEIDNGTKESPLAYVSPRPRYDDTQLANARLIAAAPELLEALEMIVRDGMAEFNSPDDPILVIQLTREEFTQARNAIAKAKGGM